MVQAARVDVFNFSFRFECPIAVRLLAATGSDEKRFSAVCNTFKSTSTSSAFGGRQRAIWKANSNLA